MSSSEILQDLAMLTKSLMIREGIKRYQLQIHGFCEKGENFIGDVVFFSVVNLDTNKKHNLVMKTAKRSEDIRKTIPVVFAYKRESFMYRDVFPAMKKF
ncbi:hypothetical protein WA026_005415 [Henosepilachna vigintioctopunctata]|uniref:Uncharacterized protein n=1 Tax=Henosepilachna vigintioctopunctata TaxID=420089 RepID=A0AAW1U1U0_9CUCU